MNLFDPGTADSVIAKVLGFLFSLALAGLGIWARFYKTRKAVSVDNGERKRFEDAIADASKAREEAHDANNRVMSVQHQLGRLEAENEQCNKRADRQDIEIAALKEQNKTQAAQIERLMRETAARRPLTDTDFGHKS